MVKQLLLVGLALVLVAPAARGQDREGHEREGHEHGPKHYKASKEHAYDVTRDVLVRHGFQVVKIEDDGDDRVVWYRAGNRGRGRGKGPVEKMIIRRVRDEDRIVFVDAPSAVLVDIDVRLRLP